VKEKTVFHIKVNLPSQVHGGGLTPPPPRVYGPGGSISAYSHFNRV